LSAKSSPSSHIGALYFSFSKNPHSTRTVPPLMVEWFVLILKILLSHRSSKTRTLTNRAGLHPAF
jgi:hypothetical protein